MERKESVEEPQTVLDLMSHNTTNTSEEEQDDLASISTADTVDVKSKSTSKVKVNKMVQWSGYNRKQAVLLFRADGIIKKSAEHRALGDRYHMSFKMYKTECKLVRNTLTTHGFHEAHPNSNEFSLLWTGSHLKPYVLRSMTEHQKVNHFPRSYEITRKDRLYRNVQRMQQIKGFKHFDFVPLSFVCPGEFQDFCSAFLREKGTWIVKPIASSRGRGIFLINHPDQLPLDETYVVCRYLSKPLLVDGFKFDLRIYVAVTSYDPLVVYLYEEGLSRFATVRYDQKVTRNIKNHCMHLTNYSVNKKSGDFVQNEDPEIEDYGNKWSLGALLRCLRAEGHDTTAIMMRIEDAVIKTLISVETPIATACKMFMPHRGNCFELYGFDVLLDSALRPWVLEVNLSPSLACDSPIDLKIKSHLVADLFSLTGFVLHDPMLRTPSQAKRNQEVASKNPIRQQKIRPGSGASSASGNSFSLMSRAHSAGTRKQIRPGSGRLRCSTAGSANKQTGVDGITPLSQEEAKIVRKVKEEHARRGGWVRIFPTPESWDLYSQFLQYPSTNNQMLHQRLFPDRYTQYSNSKGNISNPSTANKLRLNIHTMPSQAFISAGSMEMEKFLTSGIQRSMLYERKLGQSILHKHKKRAPSKKSSDDESDVEKEIPSRLQETRPSETPDTSCKNSLQSSGEPETDGVHNKEGTKISLSQNKNGAQLSNQSYTPSLGSKPIAMVEPVQQQSQEEKGSHIERAGGDKEMVESPELKAKPTFDLIGELKRGCILTKSQARLAFATYLTRVQYRLMSETGKDVGTEDLELANEQMDLVLRFLKRAAVNLSQPFKVVVPSRRLPVNDRRRILAKQLGDFVHIYRKETESQYSSNSRRDYLAIANERRVCQSKLEEFVASAEEDELEQVLTTYTKINKSAAIFLGSGKGETTPGNAPKPSSKQGGSQKDNMYGIIVNGMEGTSTWKDNSSLSQGHQDDTRHAEVIPDAQQRSRDPAASAAAKSSYQNAVYIYSGKMAGSQPRQRPSSAVSSMRTQNTTAVHANRPSSASLNRAQPPSPPVRQSAFENNLDDVNEALQQLTMRQQERNYYTSNVTRAAPRAVQPRPEPVLESTKPIRYYSARHRAATEDSQSQRVKKQTADDTLEPYAGAGDTALSKYQMDMASEAYSKVTGVPPSGQFRPSRQSAQFAILKEHEVDKQEELMQQSKALLEASKAKHQAMVAQAHAATKRVQEDPGVPFAPRPPKSPPTKPTTAHPIRSTSRYPLTSMRRSHSHDDVSTDFYSNVRYDTATGKAKLMKPS
ncbi:tubulin polyglutamylase TTLL5-like [Watersipora subatra]|uniref:tubulin polyglutamylase TTLL5-like n=1 Tax=Watersipora subatra TaxID=2589382 RepID=UPI00355AF6D4